MKRLSTRDGEFLDAVQSLFAAPEVLVVVRYVYGAGNRDFLILKNMSEFHSLIGKLRNRDSVVVMKSFQKIKEGIVEHAFIEAAAAVYRMASNWILIGKDNFEHTAEWAYAGSEAELREELQDRLGNYVCIVDEPNYISDEHSIGAYVPDEDGIVRPGAY
jgi:hypothetical protein